MSSEALERFVGSWQMDVVFPNAPTIEGTVRASASFEWLLGGAFVLQRSEVDHPDVPDGFCIIAPVESDRYTQHYFDSRGVVRLYEMTFDGRLWTLTREKPDFSPLDFAQRYTGTFDDDGRAIRGAWEIRHEGEDWQKDFELNYIRTD